MLRCSQCGRVRATAAASATAALSAPSAADLTHALLLLLLPRLPLWGVSSLLAQGVGAGCETLCCVHASKRSRANAAAVADRQGVGGRCGGGLCCCCCCRGEPRLRLMHVLPTFGVGNSLRDAPHLQALPHHDGRGWPCPQRSPKLPFSHTHEEACCRPLAPDTCAASRPPCFTRSEFSGSWAAW
jgi:hypothetical protein